MYSGCLLVNFKFVLLLFLKMFHFRYMEVLTFPVKFKSLKKTFFYRMCFFLRNCIWLQSTKYTLRESAIKSLFICPLKFLSICLFILTFVCLSVHLNLFLFFRALLVNLVLFLLGFPLKLLFVFLFILVLSVCLSVCLFAFHPDLCQQFLLKADQPSVTGQRKQKIFWPK